MFTFNKKEGFTLIELLVVIAIIGILASVVLASLSDARGSARDSQRISDIRSVITALEIYRTREGQYPTGHNGAHAACGGDGACLTGVTEHLVSQGLLPSVVADSTNVGTSRNYRYCGNATNYTILLHKEAIDAFCVPLGQLPAPEGSCGSTTAWIDFPRC